MRFCVSLLISIAAADFMAQAFYIAGMDVTVTDSNGKTIYVSRSACLRRWAYLLLHHHQVNGKDGTFLSDPESVGSKIAADFMAPAFIDAGMVTVFGGP